MADPDADTEEEYENSPDYYSILNVRKDATEGEIKNAYRRMCVMYHPDKHSDQKHKEIAEGNFSRIHKAYEVLSTPETRTIYDLYGQKGLDAGWEVVERKRTAQEIREEYERLQKDAEERRIQQKTNPKGSFTMQINATDLFSKEESDDPYYQDEESLLPNIEIRGMSVNQSIEAPLTTKNTAIITGTMSHSNGNGVGSVNVAMRRLISHKTWAEGEVGVGNGPTFRCKAFRNLGKKMFGTVSINSNLQQHKLSAGLQAMVARQLTPNTMGYLSWSAGSPSYMTSTIARNTENYSMMAQLQLGKPHSLAMMTYTHKFGPDTKTKVALKFGVMGLVFDYGCEHKITSFSRLGAFMSVGQITGVTLKIKLHRHTQTFNFPIMLAETFSPTAVFYGTIAPVLVFFTVKALLIAPMLKEQREQKIKETREKNAKLIAEKRKEAEAIIQVMLPQYQRSVDTEQEKHGLVILEAWYGRFVPDSNRMTDKSLLGVFDVTVPVQCLVKDSKLLATDATKSQLSGFYDPCIGEDKVLKIKYEFRDALHEVTYKDDEAVRIPKQSHRISSKIT
eukprot:TCONS_00016511-protein